jgi:hypothetical protein
MHKGHVHVQKEKVVTPYQAQRGEGGSKGAAREEHSHRRAELQEEAVANAV